MNVNARPYPRPFLARYMPEAWFAGKSRDLPQQLDPEQLEKASPARGIFYALVFQVIFVVIGLGVWQLIELLRS